MTLFEHLEPSNQNLLPKDGELYYYPAFFDSAVSRLFFEALQGKVSWRQDKIRMFGKRIEQPRLTAFYGDADKSYTYSHIKMQPEPWIDDLLEIKQRLEKFLNQEFSSVLMNLYRDGKDSMGWHSDNEVELGQNPEIASLSFGVNRVIRFRHLLDKEVQKSIELKDGSLLMMKGMTQQYWQHCIPKEKKVLSPRINLTFRKII